MRFQAHGIGAKGEAETYALRYSLLCVTGFQLLAKFFTVLTSWRELGIESG